MQVIIFDRTNDGRHSVNVSIISLTPEGIANGDTLESEFNKGLANGNILPDTAYEIVDDSTLPWSKPRELWEWM